MLPITAPTVQDIRVFVEMAKSLKPCPPWEDLVNNLIIPQPLPRIRSKKGISECHPEKLLKAIGGAIGDDRLARGATTAEEIFSPENKFKVVSTVNRILLKLSCLRQEVVDSEEVHETAENCLLEEGETLAAKGYLLYRTQKQRRYETAKKLEVIRRNGKRVAWNSEKIFNAIYKAFLAEFLEDGRAPTEQEQKVAFDRATKVSQKVFHDIINSSREVVHIEEIQDVIEEMLVEVGYEATARRYTTYRLERARLRQIKSQEEQITQILPELVTPNLLARIDFAMIDLELLINREELAKKLIVSMSIGLTEREKMMTILMNTRSLIELDPDYRLFAARIFLTYLYEEVLNWKVEDGIGKLKKAHEDGFATYIERGIELKLLSPEIKKFNIKNLAAKINPMADLKFDFLGVMTLYDRYLLHEREEMRHATVLVVDKKNKRRIEVPQYLWMRVAMGLSYNEKEKEEAAITFYNLYTGKKFCSGTPTLFNSGTTRPQLSSCYGLTVSDDIGGIKKDPITGEDYPTGIFGTFMNCAHLSKYAGGLGVDFTPVRGMGSHIKGTNGESLGIVPFLKIMNDTVVAVNQGGKRRGVACAYLESWHNDIEEFLDLRKNTGDDRRRTHDLNTANWIPDLFMIRAIRGQDWTLFRSSDVPDLHDTFGNKFKERYEHYEKLVEEGKLWGKKIRAGTLWKKMLSALYETGHPWITFKDPSNVRSPQDHVGVIHNSNLCTEIILNDSDDEHFVCNLGSINLSTFVKANGTINKEDLAKTIHTAVRMLDNVIDINFYPTLPAKSANMRHRPVGLGVMGWQDALHLLSIPFESEEMLTFADEIMEFIAFQAYSASCQLAKERGAYSTFKGSKWDRGLMPLDTLELLETERGVPIAVSRRASMPWDDLRKRIQQYGMRNSNVLAIAPTATISNIMGCSACIEPDYRHIYSKSNLSGEFISITPLLIIALKKHNLWSKEMLEDLKYHKGELDEMDSIPDSIKRQFKTAFQIDPMWLIKAGALRQKWIDQAQSLNLFLNEPDEKALSKIYLSCWLQGLKTTYYLKNKSVTDIEDASLDIKRKTQELSDTGVKKQPIVKACSLADPSCESCQ